MTKKVSFGSGKKKPTSKTVKIDIRGLKGMKRAEAYIARGYRVIKSDITYVWLRK